MAIMQPGLSLADAVLVLVYLALASVSFFALYRDARHSSLRPYCYIWGVIGVVLLLLCLQSATRELNQVTNFFRQMAFSEQWYGSRRTLQEGLVRLLEVIVLPLLGLALWLMRRVWLRYLPACMALGALLVYVGVQAISLHRIDAWMHAHHLGLLGRTWCQIGCTVLVAAALFWNWLQDKRELERSQPSERIGPPERRGSSDRSELSERPVRTNERDRPRPATIVEARDAGWRLYSVHGWLLATVLFASAHAFVVGWLWLVPAAGASIANLLVWALRTRKTAPMAWTGKDFVPALIILPIFYFAVQSLVWRREVHLPLADPLVQLAVYAITLFTVTVLCAGSYEWRSLIAPLAVAGVLCGFEGLTQLLLQVHSLHDLKTALPFAAGLNDNRSDLVRIRLPLGYWNYTAAWLMASMSLTLGMSAAYAGRTRRLWMAASAFLLFCILLTASRWGSFCTLIVLALFACRHIRIVRTAAACAIPAIILLIVNQGISAPALYTRQSHSLKYRTFRWAKAVAAVRENPWTGEGPARQFPVTGRLIAPDGLYFALLRIGGWVALSQFALILGFLTAASIYLLRSDSPLATRELLFGAAIGFAGLLVGWCLETMLEAPPFVLFLLVLLGMLLGLQSRNRRIPGSSDAA